MSTLADAVTAIRAGRRAEAREMLEHILAVDPCNVNALLWMSEVVPSPEKRCKYLGLILAVDPGNALARKGLDLLNRSAEQPSGVTVPPVPARSATISINKKPSPKAGGVLLHILEWDRTDKALALGFVLLIVIGIVAGLLNNLNSNNSTTPPAGASLLPGKIGRLHVPGASSGLCFPVAVDEAALDEMKQYLLAKDQLGIAQMVKRGSLFLVEIEQRVKLIAIKGDYGRIYILAGRSAERAGWTFVELVAP